MNHDDIVSRWKARATKVDCDHVINNSSALCYDMKYNKECYTKLKRFEDDFTDIISHFVSTVAQKEINREEYRSTKAGFCRSRAISLTMFVGDVINRVILQHYPFMDPLTLMDEMLFANHVQLADRGGDPITFLKEVLHKGLHFRFHFQTNSD